MDNLTRSVLEKWLSKLKEQYRNLNLLIRALEEVLERGEYDATR